jgi:hypothetical protein
VTIGGTAHNMWLATFNEKQQLLVEHWNGIRFVPVAVPLPAGAMGATIDSISAASSSNIWAVGSYGEYDSTTPPDEQDNTLALTEHWNGHAWTQVPSPSAAFQNQLSAVSADSATD